MYTSLTNTLIENNVGANFHFKELKIVDCVVYTGRGLTEIKRLPNSYNVYLSKHNLNKLCNTYS